MSVIATEAMQKLMKPTIADVALPEPYPMTQYQFDAIRSALDSGTVCFAHVDSLPTDPQEKQSTQAQQRRELNELEDLGILRNVSDRFKEAIETSKLNNKERGFRVFMVTEAGMMMFQTKLTERVN